MSTVGTAYVVIRAISPSLRKDIASAAESAAQAVAPAMEKVGKDIEKSVGKSAKDAAEKAGKAAAPNAMNAGRDIGEAMANALPDGFVKKAGNLLRRGLDDMIKAAGPDKKGNNLGVRMSQGFGKAISDFKIPLPVMLGFLGIPAIGGALHIIGAYAASAVSLVGAIAPAFVSIGAAGVASFLSVGGAFGALMLALKTKSPELTRFHTVLKSFTADFAVPIQQQVLPRLAQALGILTGTFPVLRTGLAGLGGALGDVAIHLARVLNSSLVLHNLSEIFRQGVPQLHNYGSALGSVVQIVTTFAAIAAPFATQFSKFVAQFAAGAANATLMGAKTGALSAFMQRSVDVAKQLGGILGNLGRALYNVFSASAASGKPLLDNISALVKKFADFTASARGKTELRDFFANALPIVHAVNGLIGDIIKLIAKPLASGNTGGIIAFVGTLRTQVLPALSTIAQSMSTLGPSLSQLAGVVAHLFSTLAGSGALGTFTGTLITLITAITTLLSLPVVGQIASYALAFGGMAKAVDLVLKPIGGLNTIMGPLGKLMFGTSDKVGLLSKVGTVLSEKVLPLIATGLRIVGTAVYGALGPVGLIIAAIALLVAGFVLAYQHSETFRNIVNKVGAEIMSGLGAALQWLQGVWATVWGALQGGWADMQQAWSAVTSALSAGWTAVQNAFSAGVGFVVNIFNTVVAGIVAVWNGIQNAFNAGVNFVAGILHRFSGFFDAITQPFQGIAQFFTGMWQVISGIFTGNLDKITTGLANMIGGIVRLFLGLPSRAIQALAPLLPGIWAFFVNVLSRANTAISHGVDVAVGWLAGLPGRAINAVNSLIARMTAWAVTTWVRVNAAITAGIARAIAWMAALPGRAMSAVNSLISSLTNWATTTWSRVSSAFMSGVSRAVSFAQALPGRVTGAVSSLAGMIVSWATLVWSRVVNTFTTGVTNVVRTAQGLPGRVVSAVGNLGSKLLSAGTDLVNGFAAGITAGLGNLLQTARNLAGKVVDAVKGALHINSPSLVMVEVGKSVGEGMQLGIHRMMDPVAAAGAKLANAAVPSTAGIGAIAAGAANSVTGTPGAGGAAPVYVQMNVSIDQLAKIGTLTDFLQMLENARVDSRRTLRSGTVTA